MSKRKPKIYDEENWQALQAMVDRLQKRLNSTLYDIGYLEGTVGNPDYSRKTNDSYSGVSLDIGTRAVAQKCVMFVSRCWDEGGDTCSIPKVVGHLNGWAPFIEAKRKSDHPEWPEMLIELGEIQPRIESLSKRARELKNCHDLKSLLIYRDEQVAHNLMGDSRKRKTLTGKGYAVKSVTYDDVLRLSRSTSEIICEVFQITSFSSKDPSEWIENSKRNTELLWKTLPVLSEVED